MLIISEDIDSTLQVSTCNDTTNFSHAYKVSRDSHKTACGSPKHQELRQLHPQQWRRTFTSKGRGLLSWAAISLHIQIKLPWFPWGLRCSLTINADTCLDIALSSTKWVGPHIFQTTNPTKVDIHTCYYGLSNRHSLKTISGHME